MYPHPLVLAETEISLPSTWYLKHLLRRFMIYGVLLPGVVTAVLFAFMLVLITVADEPVPDENGIVHNYR